MAVDYTYAPDRRYQDYLDSHNVRENIEVVLSKPIRQSIGSLEDIFKHNTDALAGALKDLAWFPSGPNENVEVARINLLDICGTLDGGHADSVTAFQSLFVKSDERSDWNPALAGPVKRIDAPAPSGDAYTAATELARQQLYGEALGVLAQVDQSAVTDWRYDQLRGALLFGIAGRGKSAATVDLRAAEEAFLTASARARAQDPGVSARSLADAGRAAYASGRTEDAAVHFHAAIDLDPRCGEAHYQLARICMQARDMNGVRRHLPNAFDCHWSYGMRAASDPGLAAKPAMVVRCLQAATHDVARDARMTFAEAVARFKLLASQQDDVVLLSECPGFVPLKSNIASKAGAFQTRLLKRAFDMRKHANSMYDGVNRMARDYVARLRNAEQVITHRDERVRARRDPADIARRWVALGTLVAFWQRFAVLREMRRNVARARRNELRLRYRLRRIEQRFGLTPVSGRAAEAQPDVLEAQWVRGSMVPAE